MTKSIGARVPDYIQDDLILLQEKYGCSKSEAIVTCIHAQAEKLRGNPQLTEMLDTLRELQDRVNAICK